MKRIAILLIVVSVAIGLNATIGWSGQIWPNSGSFLVPSSDLTVYYQIWKDGVTSGTGQGAGITATFYYRLSGESVYSSAAMSYHGDVGNNDEYSVTIAADTYSAGDELEFYCEAADLDPSYSYGTDQNENGPFTDVNPGTYIYGTPLGQEVIVTFQVDMSVAGVEGAVSVAGTFNNWTVGSNLLTDQGSDIYAGNVTFPAGSNPFIEYKFVNGSTWEDAIANRELEISDDSSVMEVDLVYFNNDDGTVPVTLSAFNAVLTAEDNVLLQWITESESDMHGYEVYRSQTSDLSDAFDLGFVQARNISTQQTYEYVDLDTQMDATYYYWLEARELGGSSNFFGPQAVTVQEGEEEEEDVPDASPVTTLLQNSPNPFNPTTTINYYIAEDSEVTLKIYNMKGQLINTLIDHQQRSGGDRLHSEVWESKDQPSGLYFYQLTVNDQTFTRKMLLLK